MCLTTAKFQDFRFLPFSTRVSFFAVISNANASQLSARHAALSSRRGTMESSLRDLALLAVVLTALVVGGWVGKLVDAPLVGEIVVGMLCGPSGANLLPTYAVDGVLNVGNLALVLLVMEGGLSVDVGSLRRVGPIAFLIAFAGTGLPIALGTAFMVVCGYDATTGVVAGTALSSTSIGMATRLMSTFDILQTELGSLICVAAMVDDVLSLVILAIITEGLGSGDSGSGSAFALTVATPALVSIAVVVVAMVTFHIVPFIMNEWVLKQKVLSTPDEHVNTVRKQVLTLFLLFSTTLAFTVTAGYFGSTHLLGAFVGGLVFSNVKGTAAAWDVNEPTASWLYSVFFLSVGFRIPLGDMFEVNGFGLGMGYTISAVVGKLVSGLLVKDRSKALVIGWAMVGRGELGFVMAQSALINSLISSKPYVACIWALLVATVVSPIFMKKSLVKWKQESGDVVTSRP